MRREAEELGGTNGGVGECGVNPRLVQLPPRDVRVKRGFHSSREQPRQHVPLHQLLGPAEDQAPLRAAVLTTAATTRMVREGRECIEDSLRGGWNRGQGFRSRPARSGGLIKPAEKTRAHVICIDSIVLHRPGFPLI